MRSAPNVIVVDASAVVDFLIRRRLKGAWVADRFAEAGIIHGPHLVDIEVASLLRRFVRSREIDAARAGAALALLPELRLQRYPMTVLLVRIWSLRETLSAYDAAYVALAEALDLPLLTTDGRLARSHGHEVEIVSFPA